MSASLLSPSSRAMRLQDCTSNNHRPCSRWEAEAGEQGAKDRKAQQYPRRVAPSRDERQGAAHAAYLARMAAHFAEASVHQSQPYLACSAVTASNMQQSTQLFGHSVNVRAQRTARRPVLHISPSEATNHRRIYHRS